MISIDWGTRVISVPKSDLTVVQLIPQEIYNLDLDWFRLQLKDLEDGEDGMPFPDTHRHNAEVSLSGITFARVIEIINNFSITFEDGTYAVNLVGANSNVADKVNVNQVSVRSQNSAGMVVVREGSGLSEAEHDKLLSIVADPWSTPIPGAYSGTEAGLVLNKISTTVNNNQALILAK